MQVTNLKIHPDIEARTPEKIISSRTDRIANVLKWLFFLGSLNWAFRLLPDQTNKVGVPLLIIMLVILVVLFKLSSASAKTIAPTLNRWLELVVKE